MHRALYMAPGKHGRQSLVAASNCNNSTSRLYLTDRLTEMSFLFDTGADLCVYPRSCLRERRTKTSYGLFAANGSTVQPKVALPCVWISAYDGSFHGDLSSRT